MEFLYPESFLNNGNNDEASLVIIRTVKYIFFIPYFYLSNPTYYLQPIHSLSRLSMRDCLPGRKYYPVPECRRFSGKTI